MYAEDVRKEAQEQNRGKGDCAWEKFRPLSYREKQEAIRGCTPEQKVDLFLRWSYQTLPSNHDLVETMASFGESIVPAIMARMQRTGLIDDSRKSDLLFLLEIMKRDGYFDASSDPALMRQLESTVAEIEYRPLRYYADFHLRNLKYDPGRARRIASGEQSVPSLPQEPCGWETFRNLSHEQKIEALHRCSSKETISLFLKWSRSTTPPNHDLVDKVASFRASIIPTIEKRLVEKGKGSTHDLDRANLLFLLSVMYVGSHYPVSVDCDLMEKVEIAAAAIEDPSLQAEAEDALGLLRDVESDSDSDDSDPPWVF